MKSPHFAVLAAAAALSTAAASAEVDVRPDSLLAVDTHRESIVEKSIAAWPGGVAGEQAEIVRLADELASLRVTQADVAALRAAMSELLRERNAAVTRTRLDP